MKQVRHGVQQMFSGLGLSLFFLLFFGSLKFAAIGILVFLIGLGRALSASLVAEPRLTLGLEIPFPSSDKARHRSESRPPGWDLEPHVPRETTDGATWALPSSADVPPEPPRVTEHTTVPLESPDFIPPRQAEQK